MTEEVRKARNVTPPLGTLRWPPTHEYRSFVEGRRRCRLWHRWRPHELHGAWVTSECRRCGIRRAYRAYVTIFGPPPALWLSYDITHQEAATWQRAALPPRKGT